MGDRTYRVERYTSGRINVLCYDHDPLGDDAEGDYACAADLPAWLRNRLVVLQVLPPPPPPSTVPDVGQRLFRNERSEVFWVHRGDTDGVHS